MKEKPHKNIFSKKEQLRLRKIAIEKIQKQFLPNENILKLVMIGSSVKGTFGQYDPPGFRGSLYSDFDFIFFVTDDYNIPDLERVPDGTPFPKPELNLAFRQRNFVEQYDAEIFFIREKNMHDKKIIDWGEEAGIAMTEKSQNKNIVIYNKSKKTVKFDHIIFSVAIIGVATLYFFPEPATNFLYYLATALAFGLLILFLKLWQNKKLK